MSLRLPIGLLIWALAALAPNNGITQPADRDVLTLSPEDPEFQSGRYYFHDYLYAFVDSAENRTVEEVAADSFQQRFTKDELWRTIAYGGDMGRDIHYVWARLTLASAFDDDQQWLACFPAGEFDLFVSLDSNRFEHHRAGFSLPLHEQDLGGSYGILPFVQLTVPARDTITAFARLKRLGGVEMGPRGVFIQNIFKPWAYAGLDRRLRFLDAMIVGIMLAVAIYHFFIFFYQRKYVSLFFSFMVLGMAMVIMGFRGYSDEFIFSASPSLIKPAYGPVLFSIFYFFHYLFSRLYLRLPRLLPVWDKIWLGAVAVQLIFTAVTLWVYLAAGDLANMDIGVFGKLMWAHMLIRLPLLFLTLAVSALSWSKGNKAAGIYLLAMFALVFQEFVNNPNAVFGFVPIPFRIYQYTGHTVMALLFAMGIARQLKTLQEEKFAAEQAEQAGRAEASRIRELDAFKSRFFTNITHQFRTPLTIILGMIDQVQAHPSAWLNKGSGMIRRNGRRLLQLVDQILTLSRLEAGQLPARFVQGDVVRYIKYIVESFHSIAGQKNIRLQFTSGPEELAVDYEPDKLMDILSNLISNAIKFTPEGGSVWVRVQMKTGTAEALCIQVEDNGRGISREDLPHVFDRFYQAPSQPPPRGEEFQKGSKSSPPKGAELAEAGLQKAVHGRLSPSLGGGWGEVWGLGGAGTGTGIGLSLTRELVHFLQGDITVESEPGKGTVFSVTLPITRNAPAGHEYEQAEIKEAVSTYTAPPETTGQPDEKTAGQEQYTVLIVEDNRDVVEYLRIILSPRFHLLAAYDGEQGLAKAREAIPDIIISDIMMPAMDGLEMCRQLKTDKRTSHIPVILLTAKADIASRIEGLRTGADAYLAKPFNESELTVRINKLIELRAQLQERYRDIRFLFEPRHVLPEEDFHPEDHFMRELHAIVEANLAAPGFSIGQLCEQIGMSRATLYRKFRAIANQPLSDFIRRVRLHKARQLLETTELNVTQVAMDVGFKNLSTFSRNFREEFGMSPSEVKRNLS